MSRTWQIRNNVLLAFQYVESLTWSPENSQTPAYASLNANEEELSIPTLVHSPRMMVQIMCTCCSKGNNSSNSNTNKLKLSYKQTYSSFKMAVDKSQFPGPYLTNIKFQIFMYSDKIISHHQYRAVWLKYFCPQSSPKFSVLIIP